jgi:hypothetical protein
MLRLVRDFQENLKQHPPIPPGAPDDFVPRAAADRDELYRMVIPNDSVHLSLPIALGEVGGFHGARDAGADVV